ncbi:MAG TPA: hypothetical protein VFQ01_02855 [Nocardioides sp.]|nr:hypothetical protein [Nocardioides sp.]
MALAALAAVATLALAGCGGSSSSTPGAGGGSSSSTGGQTGSSSSPTAVDGVTLTAPGSRLKLGQTAKVSWKPDQKTVGVIALSVTKLQKEPIKAFSAWRLGPATQKSTPYFVHATVRNLGRASLSGKPVPLYLLDGRNTLLRASTFQARFAPCPSRPLPPRFKHDKRTSVCLVYFAPDHGKLVAISFRPTQDFEAITWKGKVSGPKHTKHKKH